jgi:hypothetical protein
MISLRRVSVRGFYDGEYKAFSTLEFDALHFGNTLRLISDLPSSAVEKVVPEQNTTVTVLCR